MKKLFTLTLIFVTAIIAAQQPLMVPGNPALETKYIKNDTYQMKWYMMKDKEKHEVARINTQIRPGKTTLSIISSVDVNNAKTKWIDSTITTLKDLSPIRHYSDNLERGVHLKFSKTAVTGKYNDKFKKQETTINDAVQSTYFDSNFLSYLIRLLPLKEGYAENIVTYDYSPAKHGLLTVQIKDVKSGTYKNKSGNHAVWIVTSLESVKGQVTQTSYFIDKEDRRIWKQEIFDGLQNTLIERSE